MSLGAKIAWTSLRKSIFGFCALCSTINTNQYKGEIIMENMNTKPHRHFLLIVLFSLAFFSMVSNGAASTISWDSVQTNGSYPVSGYKIYYGTESGNYTSTVDVGNVTSYDLSSISPSLVIGHQYYLAVLAYTTIGEEGFLSNESGITYSETGSQTQYSLTVNAGSYGTVTPSGGTYSEGLTVSLIANPVSGYRVLSWSGTNNDSATSNTNTVTMNTNKTVYVEFEEIPGSVTSYQLAATVSGGNGTVSPTSGSYSEGSVISLTATPSSGYQVKSWSGTDDDISTSNTNAVTMNSNKSIAVEFEQTSSGTSDTITIVTNGDAWKYLKGNSGADSGWDDVSFDDTSWLNGPTGIGYGDGDDATVLSDMRNNYLAVYARKTFVIDDTSTITGMNLNIKYDDGFVAYLNGEEVSRSSVPSGTLAFNTSAYNHEAGTSESFNLSSHINKLLDGTNVLAIEIHNASLGSSDLSMIPELVLTYEGTSPIVSSPPGKVTGVSATVSE